MLYELSKRADIHPNHNEDNYYKFENEQFLILVALDGCSSGRDSYFASKLFQNIFSTIEDYFDTFKSYHYLTVIGIENIFIRFKDKLIEYVKIFPQTNQLDLLSTIVFSVYDKKNKLLNVTFFGDGYCVVDGKVVENDESNMPDYLAYHLTVFDFSAYFASRKSHFFENVNDYSICTDGIGAIENTNVDVFDYFCVNKDFDKSAAMLKRKTNILTKKGCYFGDDLTILRYINETL